MSLRSRLSALAGGALRGGSASRLRQAGPSRPAPARGGGREAPGRGFLVFEHTGEVIAAERALRGLGFAVEVMGPPPDLRTGCDMVVVFDLIREPALRRALAGRRLTPLRVVAMGEGMLEPVSLFQVRDLGDWIMVRAANMKITLDRATGVIVNVSGGGCPDVPYLAGLLTGRRVDEAEEPRERGQTLCSYALQRAFEEAVRVWRG